MLKRKTVPVLGAGASVPYNFPTGKDLVYDVARYLHARHLGVYGALEALKHSPEKISEFRKELLDSQQPSVDAFLERRSEYVDVGKAAIAATLIRCEDRSQLSPAGRKTDHWYRYLLGVLDVGGEELPEPGRVSVITFNYDRSLEHFLFTAFKASYDLNKVQCRNVMEHFPIVHVHGSLGPVLGQEKGAREYRADATPSDVERAAKSIQIVSEVADEDRQFERARNIISQAQCICFLGFGYHAANLRRLRLEKMPQPPEVHCPTWGMGKGDHDAALERLAEAFGGNWNVPPWEKQHRLPTTAGVLGYLSEVRVFR